MLFSLPTLLSPIECQRMVKYQFNNFDYPNHHDYDDGDDDDYSDNYGDDDDNDNDDVEVEDDYDRDAGFLVNYNWLAVV